MLKRLCLSVSAVAALSLVGAVNAAEYLNGIEWQEPAVVTPGKTDSDAPSDAVVLFDGKDLSLWNNGENWIVKDGVATTGKGRIQTKESFGDCQLHIEWAAPTPATGEGQGRGNNGVLIMDRYEVQILDSYENKTYFDGQAGAIYKQQPPAVNAMRPPGQWNTYDIFFTAPRFDDQGNLESAAYVTVLHNGVLIQNQFELLGDTPYSRPPQYKAHPPKAPLTLFEHGNAVRFRNIWIREFTPVKGKQVREPFIRNGNKETPIK
ncbi:hypothetical protein CA13_24420 [Planctomycetes bacterium CA13]|uniref:3-keto-alpha-glucoside-1,2-lyase/3-keto-2-hydroxy-glucal hydratase domain-containing protein n=1 Tax=Novipirellula herctigrandis TaxID=2527986 RepID=A0A5C5Z135_9BACT|nr:hypothetical protein CA13_24420 [Planctomycetes bacterium CA13]